MDITDDPPCLLNMQRQSSSIASQFIGKSSKKVNLRATMLPANYEIYHNKCLLETRRKRFVQSKWCVNSEWRKGRRSGMRLCKETGTVRMWSYECITKLPYWQVQVDENQLSIELKLKSTFSFCKSLSRRKPKKSRKRQVVTGRFKHETFEKVSMFVAEKPLALFALAQ